MKKFVSVFKSFKHNKELTVVNFVGGPGAGKSTVAAEVFSKVNKTGFTTSFVSEAAKDLVWDQSMHMLLEQDWVTANQHRMFRRLVHNDVQCAITDTSMLLGLIYMKDHPEFPQSFRQFVIDTFNSYDNLVFYLDRDPAIEYQQAGRVQDPNEAVEVDNGVIDLLYELNVPFTRVTNDQKAADNIAVAITNHLRAKHRA